MTDHRKIEYGSETPFHRFFEDLSNIQYCTYYISPEDIGVDLGAFCASLFDHGFVTEIGDCSVAFIAALTTHGGYVIVKLSDCKFEDGFEFVDAFVRMEAIIAEVGGSEVLNIRSTKILEVDGETPCLRKFGS